MRAAVFALSLLLGGFCRTVVEDPSEFALRAGQATALLGSDCMNPLALGYSNCPLKRGAPIPELRIYFMNQAEYRIGDCELGLFKEGTAEAGELVIDLTPLQSQVDQNGFCLLKIEAFETYPDPRAPSQLRSIPFGGGYFIEVLADNYFSTPQDDVVSWCFKVSGTNKGRRKMEPCKVGK